MAAEENYESLRADLDELTTDFNQFRDTKQQQHSAMQSEVNNLRFSNLQAHSDIINQINILKTRIDNINPEDEEEIDYSAIRSQLEYLNNELNILKNRVDNIINPGSDDDEEPQDYSGLISALNELETSFNLLTADYEQFKIAKQQQNSALQTEINNMRFNNTQEHESIIAQINVIKERLNNLDPSGEDDGGEGSSSQEQQSLQEQLAILQAALETLDTDYRENKTTRQQQISLMQAEINNLRFNNTQQFQNMQTEIDDFRNTQTQQMENLSNQFDELQASNAQSFSAIIADLHTLEEQAVRFDTPQAKTPEEKLRGRQNLGVPELDSSLTVPGRSADAAKVGQQITEIQKALNVKADRFVVGEDGLLYVYAGEEQIAALGPFAGGGGSGGGGGGSSEPTNNAVITARNTTGWITTTISSGGKCEISFDWSSTEEGYPTGEGSLIVYVNGLSRINRGISQGQVKSNVTSYLSPGKNTIRAAISDIYANTFFINWTVIVVSLSMRSDFDVSAAYSGPITFTYIPTGEVEKTIYVKIGDQLVGTETTEYSGRQMTMMIPAQTHGSHTIQAWCQAVINDTFVTSNVLQYQIICKEDGNNDPIITSTYKNDEVEQYATINIRYRVYSPSSINSVVTLKANNQVVNTITVDRTQQLWSYRAQQDGNLVLSIQAEGGTPRTWSIEVNAGAPISEAITENLELYLTSKNRSNGQENPGTWTYNNISATMSNFNYVSNGWVADSDGITVLRLSGSARVNIPLQVFARDFRSTGKTIELEFATHYVRNYDSPIISCMSGNRGFEVTSQRAILKSQQVQISTQFKEDEHVRITFVVEKRSENRLIYIYINGIMSGVIQYPDEDDFSQINPVGITIGSSDSTVDIYNIRIYDNNLNRLQVVDNWIADTQNVDEMLERYARNNVFNQSGNIVISKLPEYLPYMILNSEGTHLPQYKGDKVTISLQYVNPQKPTLSYIANGVQFDVQGTSSQYYARKNYKAKYKNGVIQNGAQVSKYAMVPNGIAASVFCFKKDVASSEGANNVELVKLYDEAIRLVYKTPAQEENALIRTGIDGYPMVIFENNGDSIKFVGKYNHNFDKGAENVFGFVEGDESWEVKNNTSNRVLWKSADYSGDDWLNDFEARYPDEDPAYEDNAQLAELAAFLVSTDRTAATNNSLSSQVVYNGVTYTTDSAEYRLAKFKAEIDNYVETNSMLFYYLFTELFLMVDSRAKNMFPSFMGTSVIGQ